MHPVFTSEKDATGPNIPVQTGYSSPVPTGPNRTAYSWPESKTETEKILLCGHWPKRPYPSFTLTLTLTLTLTHYPNSYPFPLPTLLPLLLPSPVTLTLNLIRHLSTRYLYIQRLPTP